VIIIRRLKKYDAAQIARLIPQLTLNIVDPKRLRARIARLPKQKNSRWLVAVSINTIVGFGGLAWYDIPSKGRIAWVEEVVVDESFRGQGIGREIMQALLGEAALKKASQVKLTASAEAKDLYLDLGFSKKDHEYMVMKIA
jgi:predicted GNAT family N-acyltransferase